MNSLTDQRLLREYAERRVEAAFGELVRRHVDLVYAAALRMVRDAHLAEDVKEMIEKVKADMQTVLTPEQARIFAGLITLYQPESRQLGFNFSF